MLNVSNISKSYGDQVLFGDLTVNVASGDRIALIGSNGSGKSTLLDILAGETSPDSGTVSRVRHLVIGYLKQDLVQNSGKTPLEEVLEESSDVRSLRNKINDGYESFSSNPDPGKQKELLRQISRFEGALVAAGGRSREHEAEVILSGLGFDQAEFHRPLNEFSGGWLMRVALAKLLFTDPDLLLLDEPTNHLDLESNLWLEGFLRSYEGSVIFTSHDRAFLNRVATMVLAIEPGEIVRFPGNYDGYIDARERSLKTKQSAAERQQREVQRQMRFIERFRSKARKASQVQSRLKRLERIEHIQPPRATKRVHFTFPEPSRSGAEVISLNDVSKVYGDHTVYRGLNLILERGDRVALVGPNGAGKTTMLKILAGVIPFDEGERTVGHNVITAYYAQHLFDLLAPENTLIGELQQAAPEEPDKSLRHILGGFLFSGEDVRKHISVLSGGEKARVALAKLLVQQSNLLFMDEPTNHLDIESREILTDALTDYGGTICFITHDRTVIRQVANKIIDINNGQATVFPGDYDGYLHRKQLESPEGHPGGTDDGEGGTSPGTVPKRNRSTKKRRGPTRNPERNLRRSLEKEARTLSVRIEEIDTTLVRHEAEIKQMETLFSDPDRISDKTQVVTLGEQYQVLTNESQRLWEEWERLSSEAEDVDARIRGLDTTE